jgi:hypothetical protein
MAAFSSNGGNRWNILGFNFTKREALSSVYKIFMHITYYETFPVAVLLFCDYRVGIIGKITQMV